MRWRLEALNALEREPFANVLGAVYECSPWVAEKAWEFRPYPSVAALAAKMEEIVRLAGESIQLELLRAHPDLGRKIRMTDASMQEQAGAGLDRLTPEEYAELSALNERYTRRFAFPFIMAVRGQSKETILAAMKERVHHTSMEEWRTAIGEVCKIAGFRLQDLMEETG